MDTHYDIIEIRADHDPLRYRRGVDLTIYQLSARGGAEQIAIAENLTFRTLKEEDFCCHQQPTVTIGSKAAQQLMDELWRCGLRPTAGAGSAGQLTAVQSHLEDMRSLVFKTAPKPTKGQP